MNSVTIIHVGDFKEKYFKEAESEYIKRLKAFCDYKTVCIKEESCFGEDSEKLIARAL
ncbi:MAG: 23S rRNA (pseudouridine(1915)-N(3))-methyltransferase RlmH, partial [Clostridia bacterium]|nr:23S rRNA (pseudouridine(1915)-N(3))-methyltransferase RlmH [Clostridia bacterium]